MEIDWQKILDAIAEAVTKWSEEDKKKIMEICEDERKQICTIK